MKHTLENILKVLKAEQKLLWELQKSCKEDNDNERATKYMKERMGVETAILLIEKKDYFDSLVEILDVENKHDY